MLMLTLLFSVMVIAETLSKAADGDSPSKKMCLEEKTSL